MKYKIVRKNGRYRRKLVLEWHEKLALVVIILAGAYTLAQTIRYVDDEEWREPLVEVEE